MVCTDKTGILTLNLMSVEHLWVMDEAFDTQEFTMENKRTTKREGLALTDQIRALIEIATLNLRVIMDRKEVSGIANKQYIYTLFLYFTYVSSSYLYFVVYDRPTRLLLGQGRVRAYGGFHRTRAVSFFEGCNC